MSRAPDNVRPWNRYYTRSARDLKNEELAFTNGIPLILSLTDEEYAFAVLYLSVFLIPSAHFCSLKCMTKSLTLVSQANQPPTNQTDIILSTRKSQPWPHQICVGYLFNPPATTANDPAVRLQELVTSDM